MQIGSGECQVKYDNLLNTLSYITNRVGKPIGNDELPSLARFHCAEGEIKFVIIKRYAA